MKNLFKGIFTKKKKEEKKEKEVLVIDNSRDNKCLCERNHGDEVITGFCFKHHTDWM